MILVVESPIADLELYLRKKIRHSFDPYRLPVRHGLLKDARSDVGPIKIQAVEANSHSVAQ